GEVTDEEAGQGDVRGQPEPHPRWPRAHPAGCPRSDGQACQPPLPAIRVSASDLKVVADVNDTARHPGGIDHRVVLGPGADVAGQRDDAVLGDYLHVAVVGNQRGAVQRLLDVQVDVDRAGGVVADLYVVPDVAEADQPGDCP